MGVDFKLDGFPKLCLWIGVTAVIQFTCFLIAFKLQFDKITDFAASMNFLLIAIVIPVTTSDPTNRQFLLSTLVAIWACRLGFFLLYRVLKRGKDSRFDEMRAHFWSFLGFWIFQIIWVSVCSFPVILSSTSKDEDKAVLLDYIGVIIWVIGLLFESVADFSKMNFLNSNPEKHQFLRTGVWKYSRHPNYFGEILCWIGIYIISVSTISISHLAEHIIRICSPVLTALLLLFLSGMPLAEDKSDERYGHQKEYQEYKSCTSPLIPFPPPIYGVLPQTAKAIFFLELPLYSRSLHKQDSKSQPLTA